MSIQSLFANIEYPENHKFIPLSDKHWQLFSDPSSLTERLKSWQLPSLTFNLLFKGYAQPYRQENYFALNEASNWIREITWNNENQILVAARVLIPIKEYNQTTHQLMSLGESPLGNILFDHNQSTRTVFEYGQIVTTENDFILPVRRSEFHYSNQPILITEIFLPAIFELFDKLTHAK